jgi:ribonuclease P protein component
MLPARHRLRESADFTAAVRGPGATRAGGRLIVVHANRTDARAELPPRVGFVVSKAVGNAVVRNKVRRRLRHLVRPRLGSLPPGSLLVVRALPGAASAAYDSVGADLDAALAAARNPRRPR